METDIQGLGAILFQKKSDGKLHPVTHATDLRHQLRNTELETLAVIWTVQHFHAYLYGCNVTVTSDHSIIRLLIILDKPSSNDKYVRWWLKIFGSVIGHLRMLHQPGCENVGANSF